MRAARFNFVKHLGGAPDPAYFDRTVQRVKALGWHVQAQLGRNASPANIHMTVMAANAPHVERWIADLGVAVESAKALPSGAALVGAIGDAVAGHPLPALPVRVACTTMTMN